MEKPTAVAVDILLLAREGRVQDLREEFDKRPGRLWERDEFFGLTALDLACEFGKNEVVAECLDRGISPNDRSRNGHRPLHIAAFHGQEATQEVLIRQGADVNCVNGEGGTPLHMACFKGHQKCVASLLKHGANIDAKESAYGFSPLHVACQRENEEVATYLVIHGADVELKDSRSKTPYDYCRNSSFKARLVDAQRSPPTIDIHNLAKAGRKKDLIAELALHSHRIDEKDTYGMTCLDWACEYGAEDVANICLERGADVNCRSNNGHTPLHIAAFRGHIGVVNILVTHGADLNARNADGGTPLHMGCFKGYLGVVRLLIVCKADLNICESTYGVSALHIACQRDNKDVVMLLLEYGADLSIRNNAGRMAMDICGDEGIKAYMKAHLIDIHSLAKAGSVNVLLAELSKHPGRLHEKDELHGMTALDWACKYGKDETVEALLRLGSKPDGYSNNGNSPIHIASFGGHTGIVAILLRYGANVDGRNADVGTALHVATWKGYTAVVDLLIQYGADINAKVMPYGVSPLHIACQSGQKDIAEVLIRNGADTSMTDAAGRLPLGMCEEPTFADHLEHIAEELQHSFVYLK